MVFLEEVLVAFKVPTKLIPELTELEQFKTPTSSRPAEMVADIGDGCTFNGYFN